MQMNAVLSIRPSSSQNSESGASSGGRADTDCQSKVLWGVAGFDFKKLGTDYSYPALAGPPSGHARAFSELALMPVEEQRQFVCRLFRFPALFGIPFVAFLAYWLALPAATADPSAQPLVELGPVSLLVIPSVCRQHTDGVAPAKTRVSFQEMPRLGSVLAKIGPSKG
jgi:hypothetical protein